MSNPWEQRNTDINPQFDNTMQGVNFINNPQINQNNSFLGQSTGQSQGQMLPSISIFN
ncbi:MAG: hypothetical protein FWF57_02810 [Defluviitaleaceae bacterium]|nr:hypothetical protein [Defluviitaleaceae bacterium]